MFARSAQSSRIPILRPLRPPDSLRHRPSSRSFARQTQLLLLTRDCIRPQLPFLSQPVLRRRLSPVDKQLLRLLSTESRRVVRDYAWLTAKWSTLTWTILFLLNVMAFGLSMEVSEHRNPTPAEWRFWTRQAMRQARVEIEALSLQGYIDWNAVATAYLEVIRRLEDQSIDGQGTSAPGDLDEVVIVDLNEVGRDVSGKSWAWRQGYFEALMGAAQASENLEGMVRDRTRNLIFPESTVIGPSNPDPRPVSKDMESAPLEENCERPMQPPDHFYVRVLTGIGFTTRQRLAAALAYANWLEHTGLSDAAGETLKWAVDIARSPAGQQDMLTPESYIIDTSRRGVSENLLRAVTAYGVHQARTGNATAALPVLLSVFKARQEADITPVSVVQPKPKTVANTDIDRFIDTLRVLFTPKPFPSPPSSGDGAYTRTAGETCEDSELMLYIGELMYAKTARKDDGIAWTQRAIDLAEREMKAPTVPVSTLEEAKAEIKKCRQCLSTGVENWKVMLEDQVASIESSGTPLFWSFARWVSGSETRSEDLKKKLAKDLERLEDLKLSVIQNGLEMEALSIRQATNFRMFAG